MRQALILLALLGAMTAQADCLPKEAGGTGSAIRKAAEPKTYGAVIAWTCPDDSVQWLGIRDSAQHLATPRTPESVRAWLSMLRVQHGYDGKGMSDLAYMVPSAK